MRPRRVIEVIFRHPAPLAALLVLPILASLAVAFLLPRTYAATASLWALRNYIATDVQNGSGVTQTPAQTQADALSDLLQTRTFDLAVASDANLASTLDASTRNDASARDAALVRILSSNVKVDAAGDNLLTVTYQDASRTLATNVVTAVVKEYGTQIVNLTALDAQAFLNAYQAQIADAQANVQAAQSAEQAYVQTHSNLTGAALELDPQYLALEAQTAQAEAILNTMQSVESQNTIAAQSQNFAVQSQAANALFTVLDQPAAPTTPVSRAKDLVVAAAIGLVVAFFAASVYLLLLLRRSQAIYTADDLRSVLNLPILAQAPALSPAARTRLLTASDFGEAV